MSNNVYYDDETIKRIDKYLKIIQKIANNISNEDFCILLDIFYIDILRLKPNKKEK